MASAAADQLSYSDLYARWERAGWSAAALHFAADREDWRTAFSDFERRAATAPRAAASRWSGRS